MPYTHIIKSLKTMDLLIVGGFACTVIGTDTVPIFFIQIVLLKYGTFDMFINIIITYCMQVYRF